MVVGRGGSCGVEIAAVSSSGGNSNRNNIREGEVVTGRKHANKKG